MPISGLILTLSDQSADAEQALTDLESDARYELGPRSGRRQPVTLSTCDRSEDKACWHWLQTHRGIVFVDVACVYFEDEDEHDNARATANSTESIPPLLTRSRPW